ncbi:MAG: hypothetical protein MUC50_18110 [Myxococcota bacterium]|nr:hypothetical protein [Myxococcota bacterium]
MSRGYGHDQTGAGQGIIDAARKGVELVAPESQILLSGRSLELANAC